MNDNISAVQQEAAMPSPGKKKSPLKAVVIIVLCLLAAGGALGAYFAFFRETAFSRAEDAVQAVLDEMKLRPKKLTHEDDVICLTMKDSEEEEHKVEIVKFSVAKDDLPRYMSEKEYFYYYNSGYFMESYKDSFDEWVVPIMFMVPVIDGVPYIANPERSVAKQYELISEKYLDSSPDGDEEDAKKIYFVWDEACRLMEKYEDDGMDAFEPEMMAETVSEDELSEKLGTKTTKTRYKKTHFSESGDELSEKLGTKTR